MKAVQKRPSEIITGSVITIGNRDYYVGMVGPNRAFGQTVVRITPRDKEERAALPNGNGTIIFPDEVEITVWEFEEDEAVSNQKETLGVTD